MHKSKKSFCCNLFKVLRRFTPLQKLFSTLTNPFSDLNSNVIAGWNDMVAGAHRIARADFLEWVRCGKPRSGSEHQQMCRSRARFKYALRACRNETARMEADALAHSLMRHDYCKFWRKVQGNLKPTSNMATSVDGHTGAENIAGFWKCHYEGLLNSVSRPDHSADLNERLDSVPRSEVLVTWGAEDLSQYRRQLKSGKATGMDGISPEHLKWAPVKIDVHLALIFNALLCHSFISDSFMPVRIVPMRILSISSAKSRQPGWRCSQHQDQLIGPAHVNK